MNTFIRSAILAAITLTTATACGETSSPAASPATARSTTAPTSTGFPTPPPYTVEVVGNQIQVSTASDAETDLRNTYNTVARTLRPTLPEGAYWVRINCANGHAGQTIRLANGTIGIGRKGIAIHGSFGEFAGVQPGAHCP